LRIDPQICEAVFVQVASHELLEPLERCTRKHLAEGCHEALRYPCLAGLRLVFLVKEKNKIQMRPHMDYAVFLVLQFVEQISEVQGLLLIKRQEISMFLSSTLGDKSKQGNLIDVPIDAILDKVIDVIEIRTHRNRMHADEHPLLQQLFYEESRSSK